MKPTSATLSEHLLAEARRYFIYPFRKERNAQEDLRSIYKAVTRYGRKLIASRQWFEPDPESLFPSVLTPKQARGFRQWLDHQYTCDTLEAVPRWSNACSRWPSGVPNQPRSCSNRYLREATRSYIFGPWTAAAALARAAVETALRDRLEATAASALTQLLTEARRRTILSGPELDQADAAKTFGDVALHRAPSTQAEALRAVDGARAVLEDLYR